MRLESPQASNKCAWDRKKLPPLIRLCYHPAGPFKINGVPLRRVNQAYVIATSTKVKVPKVDVTDKTFARAADAKGDGEDAFFAKAGAVSDLNLCWLYVSGFSFIIIC